MTWQKEFVKTFYEVVNQENIVFSNYNKNMKTDDWYPGSIVDLKEREWQYLLFKGLLTNDYFDSWIIQLERAYSVKKHAKSRRRHVDFTLTETKYRRAVYELQICVEMKRGLRGVGRDYQRLVQDTNPERRGLLVYEFSENPIQLEGKVNELPEFRRRKPTIDTQGDMAVNVIRVGGNSEGYYFRAVLLSW